jgi:DNA replication and repair protein RecF
MLSGIRLQNFRSYTDQAFELENGVNIVVGPNASGKTNLLEALFVQASGKSFRVRDRDLIQYEKDWLRIDAEGNHGESRIVKIKNTEPRTSKTFEINQNTTKRLRVEDRTPVVLFAPDHLQLLTGSPERRRQFIDQLAVQLQPERSVTLSRYQRTLLQRNNLLKADQIDEDQLFVWSIKLAELGSQIYTWRQALITELNAVASEIYGVISGGSQSVVFTYLTDMRGDYETTYKKRLIGRYDTKQGFTSVGPHRDDIQVLLDEKNSATTASRGETRTLVLVAKIIELSLLEARYEQKPLVLLDDVFSELDAKRRSTLSKRVDEYQTIITTTDADAVLEHFSNQNVIAL